MPDDPMPCGDCPLLPHCTDHAVACKAWREWTSTGEVLKGWLCVGLKPLDDA